MPRTQQQPVQSAPNQPYGTGGEQEKAQQAIPLPRASNAGPPAPAQPQASGQAPPMPQGGGGGQPQGDPMQQAIQFARDFDPGITPLTAPTSRPGEPVQAGLSMGPGAGPEIFNAPARAMAAADILTKLALASGNDRFMESAAKIRGTGGMR